MDKQSLKQHCITLLIIGMALAATFAMTPVYAQVPVIPQAFYGTIEMDGQPAPVGTIVEARGANVKTGITANPLTTTEVGKYSGPSGNDIKLAVQGNITNGSPIEFYVNGIKAECAVPGGAWQSSYPFQSEAVTELNLRVGQGATPTVTQQSGPTSTASPTSTSTVTPAAGNTQGGNSPAPTATRQTPQATGGGTTPQPTAGSGTPAPQPSTPVAQPTGPQKALITQPTQLASQSSAPTSAPTPAVPSETSQAVRPSPTATQEAQPTTPPATATPAAIAKASAGTPRPTSAPILSGEAQASTQSSPAPQPNRTPVRLAACLLRWGGRGFGYRCRCRGGDRAPSAIRIDVSSQTRLLKSRRPIHLTIDRPSWSPDAAAMPGYAIMKQCQKLAPLPCAACNGWRAISMTSVSVETLMRHVMQSP